MAYSSKADAIAKLANKDWDHGSLRIYTSDTNYDSNTIFYSNAAKTQFLSAGNYILPTNYRTVWVTIGNDGKIVGTPELLFTTAPDASWISDTLYHPDLNERVKTSHTDAQLSGNLVSDTKWSENTYPGFQKQWSCNMGAYNTTPMTNIDVSEMKGFDLMFYNGAYGQYNFYEPGKVKLIYVHVGQDINRQTVFTENGITKIYFFRPDYWVSKSTINRPTFFRFNPAVGAVKNQYGLNKAYDTMEDYIHDVLQYDRQTPRTSTLRERSLIDWQMFYNSRNDTTEQQAWTAPGRYNTNVSFNHTADKGIHFDQPLILRNVFSSATNHNYDSTNTAAGGSYNSLDIYRIVALFRSMYLEQFTGTTSVTWGGETHVINYADVNIWQWTCAYATESPTVSNGPNSHPGHPVHQFIHSLQTEAMGWYWDFEDYNALGQDDIGMRGVYKCLKIAREYCVTNNLRNVKIVPYGGGVYRMDNYYLVNSINSSNYATSSLYNEYHSYITLNASKDSLLGLQSVHYDYADGIKFSHSFVMNYTHEYSPTYYFYLLLHETDIVRKLLRQKFGTNNHGVKVSIYSWTVHDIVGDRHPLDWVLVYANGGLGRSDHSPDFMQSLGAWGFGYCDGVYQWNWGAYNVEDLYDNLHKAAGVDYNNNGAESPFNNFAAEDWTYWTQYAMFQNKDIIEAATEWQYVSQSKGDGTYTTGTDNYPISLYAFQRPIITIKFNAAGTEALILAINPFNNGYTKSTKTVKLPNNSVLTIDMWGNYTTILRIKL